MQATLAVPLRSSGTTYLLWFFLGALGVHKFYLGKAAEGVLYALTLGLFGIGLLFDLFTIPSQVRDANVKLVREVAAITGTQVPEAAQEITLSAGQQVAHGLVFAAVIVGMLVGMAAFV